VLVFEVVGHAFGGDRGATDRIHLVIDALVNPWLEPKMAEATAPMHQNVSVDTLHRIISRHDHQAHL